MKLSTENRAWRGGEQERRQGMEHSWGLVEEKVRDEGRPCLCSSRRCRSFPWEWSAASSPPQSSAPAGGRRRQRSVSTGAPDDQKIPLTNSKAWDCTSYPVMVSIRCLVCPGRLLKKVRRATAFQASSKQKQPSMTLLSSMFRLYNVLCPVTARLKPVSLMWACMPWTVLPEAAPITLGLNSLMMSGMAAGGGRKKKNNQDVCR